MSVARVGMACGLVLAMVFGVGCGSTPRAKARNVTIRVGEDLRGYEVSVAMIGVSESDAARLENESERAEFFDRQDGSLRDLLGDAWIHEFPAGTGERSATLGQRDDPWPAWVAGTKNGGPLTKAAILARIGANRLPQPLFLPLIEEDGKYPAVSFEVTDRLGIRPVVAR